MTQKKKSSSSNFIAGLVLCALMVGAWQIWANQGKETRDTINEPTEKNSSIRVNGSLLDVKTNPGLLPDQKVIYPGMDISFNPVHHQPNWVAWELSATETDGAVKRETKFYCDESVEGCADPFDYNYSGYDRGHMAPAGDMKWSADAMHSSFSMANISPQAKSLNTGAWKNLEEKCRLWAQTDGAIYIVCGPILTDKPIDRIGDNRVTVPARFFKVILSLADNDPRGIGFIMPNDKVPGGMQAAAVSIDEVERVTGHDFFAALPDSIENIVEAQNDFHYWSTHKKKVHAK